MQKPLIQIVTLPDGEKVQISQTPEAWWTTHDATGYVDPRFLAPDPDQPRKRMSATKLAELERSIATCGVREALTVTPRASAPWVRLNPKHEHLPLIIVSGHRRDECAIKSQVPAVPVRIKIYADEDKHRTDGGVLNACRDDLQELEQGFEFLRENMAGKTKSQIADTHGINILTVQNRINLTKLHPDLFPLLDPDSHTNKRALPVYPASILGGVKAPSAQALNELASKFAEHIDAAEATGHDSFEELDDDARRFAMQKLLAGVIVKRRLGSVRAAEFVRDLTLVFKGGGSHHTEKTDRYQPARRKEMLMTLAKGMTESAIIDWSPDEFKRIFGLSSRENVDEFITQLKAANDVLTGIIKILIGIRDSKRVTPAEVVQLMQKRTSA